jgi:phospholipid/cholesterol/gamma-HCH transport system substrate-binding protein
MGRVSTTVKVGLFTLIAVIAALLIHRFVDKTTGSSGGYLVFARMADASGLVKRSQVRIAGIPVGNIEDIRLEGGQARIDIRMNPGTELYQDASVAKQASSLLGEFFLAITPGTPGGRKLVDGDEIRTVVPNATTDEVLQNVADIAKKVQRIADAIANSIGSAQGEQNMRETLENLAQVTAALNQTVQENRESVRNILSGVEDITTNSKVDVRDILENVRVMTSDLRTMVGGQQAKDGETEAVRGLKDRVNTVSESLERTLASLETVSGRLERGEGTLGRLSKDEKLINEIEDVATNVNEFVGGLSGLRTIVALRSDYQFRTQTVKSFFELRLQPREDKYYSLEIVNDPRGLTRIEQINVLSTNPNDPPQYQEIRSVTSNALRFSLQFAQRFGPLVGRFGLKESTGGIGLDVLLLDDAFELRQDLFGFGETVRPRWRLSLAYAFVQRLWLMGGVDDILSLDRREYFVGLRLSFDDEDLKSILPFAPSPP